MPPDISANSARTLLYDALAQNDVDMAFHRLLNLDTSNLPPVGTPPTVHPPPNQWLHDWDIGTQQWTATQPGFSDLSGNLTLDQQRNITHLGTIRVGVWTASPIAALFLPTLDLIREPVGNVNMAGNRLTGLAAPVDSNDAVNLGYMDYLLQGLNPKESVRCATTGNITLSGVANPVDGITLVVGDRVLVKNQNSVGSNGIYVTASGAWTRSTDANHGSADPGVTPANDINRAYCSVREGTVNAGTSWLNSHAIVNIIDPDPLVGPHFVLFLAAPSNNIIPGNGLNRIGNTLNVLGTAGRILVGATVDIDPAYHGQNSIDTLGVVTTGTWNGSVISPAFGGTGKNNVGNLTLSNASLEVIRTGLIPPPASLTLQIGGDSVISFPLIGRVATLAGVEVLTNKAITPRVQKIASNGKPAINTDALDAFYITSLSEDILSMTENLTGTPVDCQELVFWIKDNNAPPVKTINWGTAYDASLDLPLPTSTTPNMWLFLRFMYQSEKLKWCLIEKLNNILI